MSTVDITHALERACDMLKNFALPALVVGVVSYAALGYGGYRLLKPAADSQFEIENAWAGNMAAQKHAAACYSNGRCVGLAQAPVIGCAWRQVIAEETGHAPDAERAVEEACRDINPVLKPVVAEAKRDIDGRIARAKLKKPAVKQS